MRSRYYIFLLPVLLLILNSCFPGKNLKEGEYLVYKLTVKGNKNIPTENIYDLVKPKPNQRVFGTTPYVSIYNFGLKFYDSTVVRQQIDKTQIKYQHDTAGAKSRKKLKLTDKKDKRLEKLTKKYKEGNWIMRAPGERPNLLDTTVFYESVRKVNQYIFSKGYFQASVQSKIDTLSKNRVKLNVMIVEGEAYKIRSKSDSIGDPEVRNLILSTEKKSYIKAGEVYDEEKITSERERINKLLKGNGFYDFSRQYIFFEIDSTKGKKQIDVKVIVKNPPGRTTHERYQIGKVIFNTDVGQGDVNEKPDTLVYKDVYYVYYKKNFSKKLLDDRLRMYPGQLYNQDRILKSQTQLGFLDMYKFVNFNFEKIQTDSGGVLNTYIFASPQKRFQITQEYGVNVSQGYVPGPFGNITFRQRNIFGGFEIFETSIRYSILGSGNASTNAAPLKTKEYGVNTSLIFPRIYFPVFGKLANQYTPKTRTIVGFNSTDRLEYKRTSFRTAAIYSWQRMVHRQYNISIFDFNYIKSDLNPEWNAYLLSLQGSGNYLIRSFKSSIVSSINAFIVYNDNEINSRKKSQYFRPFIEIGGLTPMLLGNRQDTTFLGLDYFQFYKLNVDYRYYRPVRKKANLAMRINVGYARPWGASAGNQYVLPYEKYFFAGGSNSIRAWKPRRLGPGGYKDPTQPYKFEQPGQIILESSIEYRFNLSGFFDWAFFIDAGNVWNIKDPGHTKPNSEFDPSTFFSQIAVGAGYGLRLNFSFLILRLDLGSKIYDPGEPAGERFLLKYLVQHPPFGRKDQTVYNIGIGYPF